MGFIMPAEPETEGFDRSRRKRFGDTAPAEEAAPELIEPLLASADAAKGETSSRSARPATPMTPAMPTRSVRACGTSSTVRSRAMPISNIREPLTEYSEGGTVEWTYERLSNFLAAPKKYISGTSMGFAGLKKIEDRADLLAYLRTVADTPARRCRASDKTAWISRSRA
jgi:cytochrome c